MEKFILSLLCKYLLCKYLRTSLGGIKTYDTIFKKFGIC